MINLNNQPLPTSGDLSLAVEPARLARELGRPATVRASGSTVADTVKSVAVMWNRS
jgi:hypothetical protein